MHERSMRRRSARGEILEAGPEQAPRDALWTDAEGLVAIARRHAAVAMAGPSDARESHLAACRTVWVHYAAAFNASAAIQTRFADDLQDATRAFMAAQPEPDPEARPVWSPKVPASPITLEELRLILSQIIRQ
jgi:hypothetical protein